MKILLIGVWLLVAGRAFAVETCNFELHSLRVTGSELEFSNDGMQKYKIIGDKELWRNDEMIKLNQEQQVALKSYAVGVRNVMPDIRQMILDGVDLAADAINLIFNEFLGGNVKAAQDVSYAFGLLREDIKKTFNNENFLYFDQKDNANIFAAKQFESRIKTIVDSAGKEIAWNVMKAVGGSIFFDESGTGSFEARMNTLGERMEREMKQRSEKMGARSEAVCNSLATLDAKEESLKKSIDDMALFNFISIKKLSAAQ